jgi:hypothetical protein
MSALGVETAVLPTSILSNHTMFSAWTKMDMDSEVEKIVAEWKNQGFTFDALSTGYVGNSNLVNLVNKLKTDLNFRSVLLYILTKKAKEYTLRPMGDFLPNLKEIRWKDTERVASHGLETDVLCADGTSISERDAYMRALTPYLDPQYSADSMWMFHFQYNPLYKRVRDIRIVQAERFVMPDKKISCAQIKLARQGRV